MRAVHSMCLAMFPGPPTWCEHPRRRCGAGQALRSPIQAMHACLRAAAAHPPYRRRWARRRDWVGPPLGLMPPGSPSQWGGPEGGAALHASSGSAGRQGGAPHRGAAAGVVRMLRHQVRMHQVRAHTPDG